MQVQIKYNTFDKIINIYYTNVKMNTERTYAAIDLKSFYASVECVERGLDPITTCLVVADPSRGKNTICLAVTPELKKYGLSGRCRMFQVLQKVEEIRRQTGKKIEYIVAPPRMALYMEYSSRIYGIYLKYFCHEDIHVYSIDEVFIDLTTYLPLYKSDGESLCRRVILDVFNTTGITATAGLGPNLFLCKVAMDIMAKRTPPDEWGVRIALLDEISFRQKLWNHRPLTDFWRIGQGTARRLERNCLFTLGDVARRSLNPVGERKLYKIFGIDAEILIDHAWGYEPCTMAHIKNYKPENKSIVSGQVLPHPYPFQQARLVVQEMTELLALELMEQGLVAPQFSLGVGYNACKEGDGYNGPVRIDHYGRIVPKSAHGNAFVGNPTCLASIMVAAVLEVFDKIVNPNLLVHRIHICAVNLVPKTSVQPELFDQDEVLKKEDNLQSTLLRIQHKFGKNAVIKGHDLEEGGTKRERNQQIGGHRA